MIILLFKITILKVELIFLVFSILFFFASDRCRQALVARQPSLDIVVVMRMIILVPGPGLGADPDPSAGPVKKRGGAMQDQESAQ